MLYDIITRLAEDTGFSLTQQRSSLVKLANRACLDIYNMLDVDKAYREVTLVVARNKLVTLPTFVGEIRGTKIHTIDETFDVNSIGSPRYVSQTWKTNLKNWRDCGNVAQHTIPEVVGKLILNTEDFDNQEILITGQTNKAERDQDTVILSGIQVQSAKLFGPRIDSITCFTPRTSDIIIKDSDGTELAILYTDENRTRYKLIDVSEIYWPVDTENDESLIDVCYKLILKKLINNADTFVAGDEYDNAIYHWAMHLYLKPLDNRAQDSQIERASAMAAMVAAKDSADQGIVKKLEFGCNKYFDLFKQNVQGYWGPYIRSW